MKIVRILKKIVRIHKLKKNYIFLFCVYKMVEITRETWGQNGAEVIVSGGKKWLNARHIETQLGHANLPSLTLQYSSELRKQRHELKSCGKNQSRGRFLIKLCKTNNNGF